jgi:quercetin dioxygenase-like cupin family protein
MSISRVFPSAQFFHPTEGEPLRSVIAESQEAVIVAWYLMPGQEIAAHVHPQGQDTWTILSGSGSYYLDAKTRQRITVGDIVIAPVRSLHGVLNDGDEPLVFISVVAPGNAGYELAILDKQESGTAFQDLAVEEK